MSFPKAYLTLFLCAITYVCYAQEDKYILSSPIDLPQKGWNKVLCMKNGNTMLFHFEPGKKILVKVFDSLHKEIASNKDDYSTLDILNIIDARFKGLFEVNGEAVLFIDQDHAAKHGLVRIRYSGADGHLIQDNLVWESQSENKRTKFYVMKNKDNDNYEILFSTDVRHPKHNETIIRYYNNRHETIKDLTLNVDNRKEYDYCDVVGAESQPNGIVITLSLETIVVNGKLNRGISYGPGGAIYDHILQFFYIPKGSNEPKTSLVDASIGVFPNYASYTYNDFEKSLNLLLYSYKPIDNRFGLNIVSGGISRNLFFKLDEQNMSAGLNIIKNSKAIAYLQEKTDTNHLYDGTPISMFTNENGLSTLISQSLNKYGEPETRVRYNFEDYFGNIGITQFDDDGNEIWGTLLPLAQYFKSYKHYYQATDLAKRWQGQFIFGDLPEQVYNRQFLSVNNYCHGKDFYIIYNDANKNFNNSIEKPGDTVYNFDNTNACYYKINRKKEITKSYLLGEPAANEYKCSFIEGADFDEQRCVYATLVQYKKQGEVTLRMAWRHLE